MNINIRLNKNFTTQYNKLQDEFGTDIAKINGFDDGQLSYTDFIDNFVDQSTVADASIDGNSNVSHKDIVTLEKEMPKPHEKLLAFNKIYYEIQKKYGFQTANEWLRAEWIGWLYMHDANTTSFKHYCFAYDLKDLAEKGLYFIEGRNAEPAKHLSTFVDFVKEYISYACNRSSGAVGLPNLIPYMFYFWKKDVDDGYYVRSKEYYAKQQFQRFIYAVNQPYLRDGSQSAFTNTSVFDRPYFEALFGGTEFPNGTFMIDYEEEIIEFQKWYMEVMAKIRHENMFTFPVSTISLLRQNGKFVDEDFATWAIKHNMEWSDSNIFCDSSVNSLSNCCRLKSNIEDLGYFNSVGGTALKVGSIKVSTINLARLALDTNSEEEYLDELKKRVTINLKALDCVRHIIKRNVEKGLLPNFSYGLVDFPHLYNTIGFIGIYETMKKFGYTRVDELGDTYYTDKASAFGKKIFETMRKTADEFIKEYNCDYQINTEQIPGGTALKVGSIKVSTINLARLALDTNSEEEYLDELKKRVTINLKALDCVRHIIKRNVEKGLLPNFSYGLVDFPHLYNTIGFIGIYETMKKFGYTRVDELGDTYYTDKASAFGKKIFETMRKTADEFIKEYNCDYQINTEQIPGETAAAKLMRKDKFFYPNADIYDLPLYGNQFIPLGIKTTGQERVRIASEFDGYCSGGSILHYNIDAPFDSFEKAWKMTNYIADQGVTYFAFNTKIQACKHNHAFYGTKCPICGEPVDTEFTRIVGFYTPVKTYSKERKAEFEMRKWGDINAEVEEI